MKPQTIFISIASFCDPYLIDTIKDALDKSKHPENIYMGVIDQNPINQKESIKKLSEHINLRYVHINPIDSRGVCWARSLAFSLYQNETYLLQIDSHMLFEKNWDITLIDQLIELQENHSKPIISTYPYGYEIIDGKPKVVISVSDKTTLVLRPHPDTSLTDNSATLRFRAEHLFTRQPVKGCHVAGGFIFTLGNFTQEVPYDPFLYFHGEEQSLAIRAYTKGWDIFHHPIVPIYHLYKRPNTEHTQHHWHSDWEKQRDYKWSELKAISNQRLVDMFYHQKEMGCYGLGTQRTLEEYAELSGINYKTKQIIQPYQTNYTTSNIENKPMKVLCFTTSYRRPKMLRGCMMDMLNQTYENIVHGVNFVHHVNDHYEYHHILIDDLMAKDRISVVFNENAHQHTNYIRSIQAIDNYLDYDLFIKIDDDEIYKQNYVQNIVDFMSANDCDICSSKVNWQLNGFNVFKVNSGSLAKNPEGYDFNTPFSFAFNRKALQSILSIENINDWEDQMWKIVWAKDGLKHASIDNRNEVIWHIHGTNVSVSTFLKLGNMSTSEHHRQIKENYLKNGINANYLEKIWILNSNMIVFDFTYLNFKIAIDLSFDGQSGTLKLDAFDRNKSLSVKWENNMLAPTNTTKLQLLNTSLNDNELHNKIIEAIDGFMSVVIEQHPQTSL